jgi:hypothetical protein
MVNANPELLAQIMRNAEAIRQRQESATQLLVSECGREVVLIADCDGEDMVDILKFANETTTCKMEA